MDRRCDVIKTFVDPIQLFRWNFLNELLKKKWFFWHKRRKIGKKYYFFRFSKLGNCLKAPACVHVFRIAATFPHVSYRAIINKSRISEQILRSFVPLTSQLDFLKQKRNILRNITREKGWSLHRGFNFNACVYTEAPDRSVEGCPRKEGSVARIVLCKVIKLKDITRIEGKSVCRYNANADLFN